MLLATQKLVYQGVILRNRFPRQTGHTAWRACMCSQHTPRATTQCCWCSWWMVDRYRSRWWSFPVPIEIREPIPYNTPPPPPSRTPTRPLPHTPHTHTPPPPHHHPGRTSTRPPGCPSVHTVRYRTPTHHHHHHIILHACTPPRPMAGPRGAPGPHTPQLIMALSPSYLLPFFSPSRSLCVCVGGWVWACARA